MCNVYLSGTLGYYLCTLLISQSVVSLGFNGSLLNLAIIAIDRYLKVVHSTWSRKMRPWMIHSAMAFSWLAASVYTLTHVFVSSAVVDGVCYAFAFYKSDDAGKAFRFFYGSFFYVVILAIFVFCYGHILVAVRRQARVMAGHSSGAASAPGMAQTQISQMQSSVIKTMIVICAFYAVARLPSFVFNALFHLVKPNPITITVAFNTSMFLSFLYVGMNPFIYAIKFDPVRRVLRAMIPCKENSVTVTP